MICVSIYFIQIIYILIQKHQKLLKEYIKCILGLWNSQEDVKQRLAQKIGRVYIVQEFPTARQLEDFSSKLNDDFTFKAEDNENSGLNTFKVLKVDKIITSGKIASLSSSVATLLKNLGFKTSGKVYGDFAFKASKAS